MSIRCIYSADPGFPATDQHPDCVRAVIGVHVVDYTGTLPTQSDVDLFINPPPDPRKVLDEQEAAADKLDAQVQNFLNKSPAERALWINSNINNAANLADLKAGCAVAFSVLGALAANAARGKVLR